MNVYPVQTSSNSDRYFAPGWHLTWLYSRGFLFCSFLLRHRWRLWWSATRQVWVCVKACLHGRECTLLDCVHVWWCGWLIEVVSINASVLVWGVYGGTGSSRNSFQDNSNTHSATAIIDATAAPAKVQTTIIPQTYTQAYVYTMNFPTNPPNTHHTWLTDVCRIHESSTREKPPSHQLERERGSCNIAEPICIRVQGINMPNMYVYEKIYENTPRDQVKVSVRLMKLCGKSNQLHTFIIIVLTRL